MRISKVMLDSIHISTTYSGSLEGLPPKNYIVEQAKKNAIKMFGSDRPTYVVVPDSEKLPRFQYIGWFNSYTPVKHKDAFGSHLVLIWWDEKQTLDGIIEFAAAYWAHAEDYNL